MRDMYALQNFHVQFYWPEMAIFVLEPSLVTIRYVNGNVSYGYRICSIKMENNRNKILF